MKNNRLIILLWILTAVLLTSCKKDTPEPASAITFIAGNVELNGMPAAAGMTVKAGDTITTAEKSCAVIQFSQNSLVTMREKTTLEISRLVYAEAASRDQVELFQKTGITFNKVLRERAGFIVKTPTITASVRGTFFTVDLSVPDTATVSLLHGSVAVAPESQAVAAPVELADGETVTMKGTAMGAKEKMESAALEEMAILDRIGFVPGEKLKAPDNRPVPEESLKVLQAALTTGRSLAEIRKTYGSVSVIKTTDGKTYTGYFKQSGRMIDIITEKGTVTIPSSSIKKVSPY